MDQYDVTNALIFAVLPVLTVATIFFTKRKLLWTAPFISTILAFITYTIALEPSIIKILSNNEWRSFLVLAMLMQLGVAAILTVIAYLVAHRLKQR